jgi:DNA-directed RNA polymerase specialized sigma24 family protein
VARRNLGPLRRQGAIDPEDVALSAFADFCSGVAVNRFPQLNDRDDLWPLLMVITARKATRKVRDEFRQKRDARRVSGESVLTGAEHSEGEAGFDQVEGKEPTPEFVAQMAEEFQRLLGLLGEEKLKKLAEARMHGDTIPELAARFRCSEATILRRLRQIREIWERERSR